MVKIEITYFGSNGIVEESYSVNDAEKTTTICNMYGDLCEISKTGGYKETYTYGNGHELIKSEVSGETGLKLTEEYIYDNSKEYLIEKELTNGERISYEYDNQGRIKKETIAGKEKVYSYADGNLVEIELDNRNLGYSYRLPQYWKGLTFHL